MTYPHELQYKIGRAADVPDDLQRAFKTAPRHLFIVPHIQERSELTKEGFDPKFEGAGVPVTATKMYSKLGLTRPQVKDAARHTYVMKDRPFSRNELDNARVVVTTAQKAAQEIVNGNIKARRALFHLLALAYPATDAACALWPRRSATFAQSGSMRATSARPQETTASPRTAATLGTASRSACGYHTSSSSRARRRSGCSTSIAS